MRLSDFMRNADFSCSFSRETSLNCHLTVVLALASENYSIECVFIFTWGIAMQVSQ